jgi:excisionase family DNA binding protein
MNMEIKHEDYEACLREEYYTIREAADLLEINEEEIRVLAHRHSIPTHNIAGVFLRFKKKDIEDLKNKWRIHRELFPEPEKYFSHHDLVTKPTALDRLKDFWYFNDFYIICSLLILLLAYFIVSSQ